MNKVVLIGRLTRDPDIRYSSGENQIAIARYTLAVNRPHKSDREEKADFISCTAFGARAEFAEKYLRKGMKIGIVGQIRTGSYEKDGRKVYTTEVMIDEHEFCERKDTAAGGAEQGSRGSAAGRNAEDMNEFMAIPDGIDEELPFG